MRTFSRTSISAATIALLGISSTAHATFNKFDDPEKLNGSLQSPDVYKKITITNFTFFPFSFETRTDSFNMKPEFEQNNEVYARYAPAFDFNGNRSCYPAAAIDRSGDMNPGLKTSGARNGHCADHNFRDHSNTYHRAACQVRGTDTYCANFFALYFEKDQNRFNIGSHVHDIEHAVVWMKNGEPEYAGVSAHGSYSAHQWNSITKFDSEHPAVNYDEDDFVKNHIFSITDGTRNTHIGFGFTTPTIASYYSMNGEVTNNELRNRINALNFGSASFDIRNSVFLKKINENLPSGYPKFSEESIYMYEGLRD
ncbi:sugar-binding protein [Shewanella sp. OPT22]|nr:sugar-binding protein [Shewanella sp. OPT22]